jgi:hypothetical protein
MQESHRFGVATRIARLSQLRIDDDERLRFIEIMETIEK